MPDPKPEPAANLSTVEFFAFVQSLCQRRYGKDLIEYCDQTAAGILNEENSLQKLMGAVTEPTNDVNQLLRFIFNHLIFSVIGSNQLLFANVWQRLLAIQPRVNASPDKLLWDVLVIIVRLIRNEGEDYQEAMSRTKYHQENPPPVFSQVYPITYMLGMLDGIQKWARGNTNTGISMMLQVNEDHDLQKPEQLLFFVMTSFLRPGLKWLRKELLRNLESN